MNVNKELEEKLWSNSRENPFDKKTYIQLIDYLLARLSDYLKLPLETVGDNYVKGGYINTTFRGAIIPQDVFHITFIGPLGVEFIEEDEPHYSASLFLFGDHHRLTAGQPDRSFIELFYEKGENNIGSWTSLNWQIDEFEEFEDIVEDEYYYTEPIEEGTGS